MVIDLPKVDSNSVALRVLRLLGRLGSRSAALISGDESSTNAPAMRASNVLPMTFAFSDGASLTLPMGITLMFCSDEADSLIPIVSQLALSSQDRQTKVSACELLHSLIVALVGQHGTAQGLEPMKQVCFCVEQLSFLGCFQLCLCSSFSRSNPPCCRCGFCNETLVWDPPVAAAPLVQFGHTAAPDSL